MKIFKYPLYSHTVEVEIPEGGEVLTVQLQYGEPQIWVLVSPDKPKTKRRFQIFGTGFDMNDKEKRRYIGTFQRDHGSLVWHVFELFS